MTASDCDHALRRLAVSSLLGMGLGVVAACAPDSVRSVQATGFNAWFKSLPTVCRPLIIGSVDVGQHIMMADMGDTDYTYFLDNSSRLYYNRITPDAYRLALTGQMGPGTYNDASFACIVRSLPPDRPNAPGGAN